MKKIFLISDLYFFSIRKFVLISTTVLVSILFINNFSLSQGLPWQRAYKGPSWSDCDGAAVCSADSGNYYVISTNNYPRGIYILKINSLGDTLWTRFILDGEAISGASTLDNGCIITGSWRTSPISAYSLKINSSGNIIWQKNYDSSDATTCFKIFRTSNNKFLICGKTDIGYYEFGYIIKIDSNGNKIWQKFYESLNYKEFKSITEAYDGTYILCGWVTDTPLDWGKGLLVNIDTSGNVLWEKRYNISQHSLYNIASVSKTGQKYLVSGDAIDSTSMTYGVCFKIIDQQGFELSSHFYQTPKYNEFFMSDSKVINDNKFLLCYYRLKNTNDSGLANAMITDSSGNILVHREYAGTDNTYIYSSYLINSKNIFFVGLSNHLGHYNNIWLVKTDSNLYVPPIVIGINNISKEVPYEYKLFQNYPNPFNPTTKIKFDIPRWSQNHRGGRGIKGVDVNSNTVTLKIYDILGKEIATLVNEKLQPGTYEIKFDGGNLSSGIYFYSLFVNNKLLKTKKMLLMK